MALEAVKSYFRPLFSPKALLAAALSIGVGAAIGVVAGRKLGEPHKRLAELRYNAHSSMLKLHDLQKRFGRERGRYANDLSLLLASTPDGPAIRSELGERVDMNTLVVKGDAKAFRLEANVLDPERTLIKLKGP